MYHIPTVRISLVRDSVTKVEQKKISCSSTAFNILREVFKDLDREHFVALLLDVKNNVVGINTVSIGSVSLCIVHPREVFKAAILANASSIIVSHNHPSGDSTPSSEDDEITARLKQAGELLGITLLDHVVIGEGQYFSYADNGRL